MILLDIQVPGHPPSVNHAWSLGKRKFKKPEYIAWEGAVQARLYHMGQLAALRRLKPCDYKLTIELWAPTWRTGKDTLKRPDTPNLIKTAEDAVCSFLGWEDAWNGWTEIRKFASSVLPGKYTRMVFEVMPKIP